MTNHEQQSTLNGVIQMVKEREQSACHIIGSIFCRFIYHTDLAIRKQENDLFDIAHIPRLSLLLSSVMEIQLQVQIHNDIFFIIPILKYKTVMVFG